MITNLIREPGIYRYCIELGQHKPYGCQMECRSSYYGNHYYIDSTVPIKGQGIREESQEEYRKSGDLRPYRHYRVTEKALERLEKQYSISMECPFD